MKAALFPSIKVQASYQRLSSVPEFKIPFPGIPTIFPYIANTYAARATFQQPLFTGWKLQGAADNASYQADAAQSDVVKDKADLILQIKTSYWTVHRAGEVRRLAEESVSQVEAHLRDIENLERQGMATANDVLKVKVQLANSRILLSDAANGLRLATIAFNSTIGLPLETEIAIASPLSAASSEPLEAEKLLKTALASRPELVGMELRVKAALGAIALAGRLAYSNAFHGEFVFDDSTEIVSQHLIRHPDHFVRGGEVSRAYAPNRVLVYFTFALNYALGGLDTTGYHAVNILVHLGTALLVYALARFSFRTPHLHGSALAPWGAAVALVAALLFVTHPIQTQAVTYVVQRLTSLATFFYVLAVVLYVRWRMARDAGRARGLGGGALYAVVLVSALAATKSKEIALTLPVVIAVYELAFFTGPARRRLAGLGPILAMLAVIPASTFGLHKSR